MKVLVTGGVGFIGSNLVDALIRDGYQVIVVDNLLNGSKKNLNSKAKFYKVDIRNLKKIKPLFKGVDFVFHVAAVPRVPFSIKFPELTHQHNAVGTLNVLLAARDAKVKKVIFSSSSSVYGKQSSLPLTEKMLSQPMSPYGLQKLIGEYYCGIFSKIYGLPTISLRYFNVYGTRQNREGPYATAIAKFLQQAAGNKPLTIFGDGHQTRDFTHVVDVVRANILAMKSKRVGQGEVINIGAGKNYSILKIAKIISPKIVFLPPRVGEPRHTLASIQKAKKLLGWLPKVKLENGIKALL